MDDDERDPGSDEQGAKAREDPSADPEASLRAAVGRWLTVDAECRLRPCGGILTRSQVTTLLVAGRT